MISHPLERFVTPSPQRSLASTLPAAHNKVLIPLNYVVLFCLTMEICLEDIASPTIHCNNEPMVFGTCYIRTVVPPRNTDMPFPHTMHVRPFQDSHPWGLSPAAGGVEVCRAPSSCRKTQNRTVVCLFQTDSPEEEGKKEGNVLFNDILFTVIWRQSLKKTNYIPLLGQKIYIVDLWSDQSSRIEAAMLLGFLGNFFSPCLGPVCLLLNDEHKRWVYFKFHLFWKSVRIPRIFDAAR